MKDRIKINYRVTSASQPSEEEIKKNRNKDLNRLSIFELPEKRISHFLQKKKDILFKNWG